MQIDWKQIAAPWLQMEKPLEQAHQSVLDRLLFHANIQPGQHVLDVGCGTGASVLAASRETGVTGRVTGVDIAPPLVERARARGGENVDVITGDAGTTTFDHTFDVGLSLFGTMFFPDTGAAFATMRKAFNPGGRFHFAAWAEPQDNPWFTIPRAAAEVQFGPLPKPDMTTPGPFRFADAEDTKRVIGAAGWTVTCQTEALVLETGQALSGLAQMHMTLAQAVLLQGMDITDQDRSTLKAGLAERFRPFVHNGTVQVPARIHFFTATAR